MNKKKILTAVMAAALLLGLLGGCGSKNLSMEPDMARGDMYAEDSISYETAMAAPAAMSGAGSNAKSAASTASIPLPENRKWVITMSLTAETENLADAMGLLAEKIQESGGYVESQSVSGTAVNSGRSPSAYITVRVPAEQLDSFVEDVSGMTNVVSSSRYVEDITLRYTDTEGRVKALQTEEARLLELMEQAETMSDLLEIEERLTEVRYQLENYTSTLRLYDNQVDYATLDLTLREVEKFTPPEKQGFWEKVTSGLADSIVDLGQGMVDFAAWVLIELPYLVLVGLLFVGLSYVTGNMLSTYQNKVLLTVGINIILAVSLNVATGYLGQLPLGHAGFMAVGAYACALFTKSSGLPKGVAFAIGLVLAWVIAGLFGVLIGIPALRLTGDYLAILTLGFGEIIRITLNNIDDVLGFKLFYGSKGLKNIPKYSNFTNVFLCVVITCFLIHAMMKSRHGRAVLAIRDNEIAAESCGIQTTYYKVMAFAFSAAFAGLAGGLYACYIGVLNPSTFGFMKSIEILVMVVLGGMGSMLGSILSATVLTILPEATRSFESYRMVVYSLVLVLMMIFRPGGLLGSYDFSLSRIVEKAMNGELFRKHTKKEAADHE